MHAVVLDCSEPRPLVAFWSAALGYVQWFEPFGQFAGLKPPPGDPRHGLPLIFQRVPEPKVVKNRAHVDYEALDRAAEVERLVGLGGDRRSRGGREPTCAGRSWPIRPATSSAWPRGDRRLPTGPGRLAADRPLRPRLRDLRADRADAAALGPWRPVRARPAPGGGHQPRSAPRRDCRGMRARGPAPRGGRGRPRGDRRRRRAGHPRRAARRLAAPAVGGARSAAAARVARLCPWSPAIAAGSVPGLASSSAARSRRARRSAWARADAQDCRRPARRGRTPRSRPARPPAGSASRSRDSTTRRSAR